MYLLEIQSKIYEPLISQIPHPQLFRVFIEKVTSGTLFFPMLKAMPFG